MANSNIKEFVVALGKALIKDGRRDWMQMEDLAEFCRREGIKLDGSHVECGDLERRLRDFFRDNEEFYAPEVNVDGYERRDGWNLKFMVRSYPFSRVQYESLMNLVNMTEGNSEKHPEPKIKPQNQELAA